MKTMVNKFETEYEVSSCHWGTEELINFAIDDGASIVDHDVFTGCSCHAENWPCNGHDQVYIQWPDGSGRWITYN